MNKDEMIELFKEVLEANAQNVEMLGDLIKELHLENDQDVLNWADRINEVSVSF